jgi:lipid-A-disaccharide synthase
MAAVKAMVPGPVAFRGIGGRAMAAQGLDSLFPLHDIAVNGFSAILARVPHLLRRIREAVDAVIAVKPDVLVIIDSPGFTHRVAQQVRTRAPHIPIVDYVSPQMWAWRPGLAVTMRAYIDHVLALWPFEPEAYRRLGGPPCTFVGHPLAEEVATLRPGPAEAVRRTANPPLLLMLPGSRGGEVGRHLAVFGAAAGIVRDRLGAAEIVLPTMPHLVEGVRHGTAAWPVAPRIVVEPEERRTAFRQARAALAKSGTVTLELALAQVPTVLAYKVTLLNELIVRAMIKMKIASLDRIGLANVILDEMAMPELLQRNATAENLADALVAITMDSPARQRQCDAFARLDGIMEIGTAVPSERAAAAVIAMARRHRATGRDPRRRPRDSCRMVEATTVGAKIVPSRRRERHSGKGRRAAWPKRPS